MGIQLQQRISNIQRTVSGSSSRRKLRLYATKRHERLWRESWETVTFVFVLVAAVAVAAAIGFA
ncbi:MAG: hypothetical protein ACYTHK_12300 [Planctomycetota bacterium]|jgi:hypothetical protein